MFKKIRLWLIKKLKATPNEYFKNTPMETKNTIHIKDYNFKIDIPQTQIEFNEFQVMDIKKAIKDKLYKDLIDKNIITLNKTIDSERGVVTFYCNFEIVQKGRSN